VAEHIDSISFNPDAILKGIENINRAEKSLLKENVFNKKLPMR
jgi:pyruvate,water dikinase